MQAQSTVPMQSVRVLRPFYFNGAPVKAGELLELPRIFARECRAANKVEFVAEPAKAEPAETKRGAGNAR